MSTKKILRIMDQLVNGHINANIKELHEVQTIKVLYQDNKKEFDALTNIDDVKIIVSFLNLSDTILKELFKYSNFNITFSKDIKKIINTENEYNVNYKAKYNLFEKKIEMISGTDQFFIDMVYDLEKELENDDNFKNYFFKKLDSLFNSYFEQIKLTLNYITKKSTADQVYLHFFHNHQQYKRHKNTVLEIIENIRSNENDLNELKKFLDMDIK